MQTNLKVKTFEKFLDNEPNLFDGGHKNRTSFTVVREICANLKLNNSSKILVLFNVEFVIDLVYNQGVPIGNITFYSDHANKTDLVKRIGIINFMKKIDDNTIKFDVVLTNPPYQDDDGNSVSWFHIKNALDKVKPGGYLAVVSSRGWVNGKATQKGFSATSNFCKLRDWQIEAINPDTNKHFKVDKSTNYFILNKVPRQKITNILSEDQNFSIDLSKYNFLPYWLNALTYSIFEKIMAKKNFWFDFQDINASNSPAVCYPRSKYIAFDSVIVSDGSKMPSSKKFTASKIKAQDIAHCKFLFGSTLFKFLHFIYGGKDGVSPGYLRKLPKVPTSILNDADLYKYFGFSQKEIEYIEANV